MAIARAVGVTYSAAQKWKSGARYPTHSKMVIQSLDSLLKKKRIPKKQQVK